MGPWNYPRELVAIARAQWTSVYSELTARTQAAYLCVSQTAWDTHVKASELHARCLSGEAHVTVRYVKQHGSNADAAASLAGVARCQSTGWPENIFLWCFCACCLLKVQSILLHGYSCKWVFHICVLLMGHTVFRWVFTRQQKKALPCRGAILFHLACLLFFSPGFWFGLYPVISLWEGDRVEGRNMRSSVVLLNRCLVIVP